MPITKLREFLDSHHIKYVVISHSKAYTAQGIAAAAHVSGKELAKTVMVRADGKMAMAVLPGSCKVDFDLLKRALGARDASLAEESEFRDLFPECDVGAMPPFGNLYGLDVYVDEQLTKDEEIAFNACSHTELVKLGYADFAQLASPKVAKFATL